MNILVTGGLGYLGSHAVVKLVKLGWKPKLSVRDMCKSSWEFYKNSK